MKSEKLVEQEVVIKRGRKELGLDQLGIQKQMRLYHYLGDGVGQIALNAISAIVGILTYFYTDMLGMAAGVVGTMFLVARIVDAFTDLGMGKLVDMTKSKHGKVRPWLLWMAIPTLISIILLFTVPAGATTSMKYTYAFITLLLANSFVYTAISIPYGSMLAVRTKSSEERGKMGIYRTIFGYVVGGIISVLLIPISNLLGGDQRAWIILGSIFAVLSSLSLLIVFYSSKEKNNEGLKDKQAQDDDQVPFFEGLKLLFTNKYWLIMLFVTLTSFMVFALSGATGVYYAKYILGDENLVAVMGGVGLIPVILGFILIGPMIKKFGLAKSAKIGLGIGVIANVIRVFIPYSFLGAVVLGGFTTFATIPIMVVSGAMLNNTVEYEEWRSGKRMVGLINSANSFGQKVGNGLGAASIGWILAIGSYDGTLAVQPLSAEISILTIAIYLPLVLLALCFFVIRKYDLEKHYPSIIADLNERKAKE